MALDTQQQERFAAWIAARQIRPACPACGATPAWTPGGLLAGLELTSGGLRIGAPLTALATLTCANCAYVLFFAAEPLGLYAAPACEKEGG